MNPENKIPDETLNIVNGGVLLEGWDETMLTIMKIYKSNYGEEGLAKVESLVDVSINDPTSPLTIEDRQTVLDFIRENWNRI